MAKSFRYIVLDVEDVNVKYRSLYKSLEDHLNSLGSEGWEVVAWYGSGVILKKEA